MSDNLGIIFPEIFYKILYRLGKNLIYKLHLLSMNFLIRKINPGYKIIETKSDFPVGNMFWARTIAIHQIFEENIEKKFPKEKGQIDFTIMHSIERIWVYIAKLNGYYYKKIIKHL
jgi:lipopolysaccharide biosynthesis protein